MTPTLKRGQISRKAAHSRRGLRVRDTDMAAHFEEVNLADEELDRWGDGEERNFHEEDLVYVSSEEEEEDDGGYVMPEDSGQDLLERNDINHEQFLMLHGNWVAGPGGGQGLPADNYLDADEADDDINFWYEELYFWYDGLDEDGEDTDEEYDMLEDANLDLLGHAQLAGDQEHDAALQNGQLGQQLQGANINQLEDDNNDMNPIE